MWGGAQIPARLQVGIVAIAAAVGIVAVTAARTPAEARVFAGIGVGVPRRICSALGQD